MRRGLVFFLLLLSPVAASAHDADILYAQVQRAPGSPQVKELLTMTAATLVLLAPVDSNRDGVVTDEELSTGADAIRAGVWDSLPVTAGGRPCALSSHASRFRDSYLELRATFDCGEGELVQTFRLLSILPPNYKVVLGTFMNGESGSRFAQGNAQTLMLDEPDTGQVSGVWSWGTLGAEHIFRGPDHLVFLLALLLTARGLKRILMMVTAFTVAHSLTLGLTAAKLIPLSAANARWVEVAIALSIIWVAFENVVFKEPRHRIALTFAFGLIHGFGFASSLQSYGIERELVKALFGFNLGVEVAQAGVVLAVTPLIFFLQSRPRLWVVVSKLASIAILVVGGHWLLTRVAA